MNTDPTPAPVPPAQPTDLAKMVEARKPGGPGKCRHCGKVLPNISFHEQHCGVLPEVTNYAATLQTEKASLRAQLTAAQEELAALKRELESALNFPKAIRVREGGGHENLAASVAVTFSALQSASQKGAEDTTAARLEWIRADQSDHSSIRFALEATDDEFRAELAKIARSAKPEASP